MGPAIVAAVAGLLGVALGYLGQSLRARQEHKWAIETAKREAYAEFLRSISASYAEAGSEAGSQQSRKSEVKSPQTDKPQALPLHSHKSEDAALLAATARIVLLAKPEIYKMASDLSDQIMKVHEGLRSGDSTAQDEVSVANSVRLVLIDRFKEDLGIPTGDQPQHQSRIKHLIRRTRLANSTRADAK